MKRLSSLIASLAAALILSGVSAAQLPTLPDFSKEPPRSTPKPPTKPVVPSATISKPKSATTPAATTFAPELQSLSADAQAFAKAKLSTITPGLRVQAATRVSGKTVALSDIPQTWIATAGNPSGAKLWLGAKSANLVTGPGIDPIFLVAGGANAEQGVWVQFEAEAGVRHLLMCDMTGPDRWDVIAAPNARTPMIADKDTRGIALVPAKPSSAYVRVLLVVVRPLQTGPFGGNLSEALRRCEVTPIHS